MKVAQRFRYLFEDWRYLIQRDGIGRALPVISLEIVRLPFRHIKFFVFERLLSEPLPDYSSKISLQIRPFEQSDLEFVRKIDRPSEARQCKRHLESGHKGLIAFHQGQPIGYAWGCADVIPEIEKVPIQLEPGDVLCTDVFTNPSFRGQGVQTAMSLARFRMFHDLGFSRAICYIEIHNRPSLTVWQKKLGGLKTGSIDFFRIGPLYRVRFRSINSRQKAINRGVD
ncbi:MAG: GNAT family N-acetyltransferase [Anaerolineaceae bacterium]